MRFRFSRRAAADLEEIAEFIARDKPVRAVSFVQEMREHCRTLVRFPEAHRQRPELGRGVRVSVFGAHLILYVAEGDLLEVRRVVHGSRDIGSLG